MEKPSTLDGSKHMKADEPFAAYRKDTAHGQHSADAPRTFPGKDTGNALPVSYTSVAHAQGKSPLRRNATEQSKTTSKNRLNQGCSGKAEYGKSQAKSARLNTRNDSIDHNALCSQYNLGTQGIVQPEPSENPTSIRYVSHPSNPKVSATYRRGSPTSDDADNPNNDHKALRKVSISVWTNDRKLLKKTVHGR